VADASLTELHSQRRCADREGQAKYSSIDASTANRLKSVASRFATVRLKHGGVDFSTGNQFFYLSGRCSLMIHSVTLFSSEFLLPFSGPQIVIVSRETILPQATNKACFCIGSSISGVDNTAEMPILCSTNRLASFLV